MTVTNCVGIAAVGTMLMAAGWASAQSAQNRQTTPTVLFGNDVGFRVESERGGRPVGVIVVKRDGRWVEAQVGVPMVRPLTTK